MRFTPTKRLRRERACSTGCAQQSCLGRWSPRSRRRTQRKIRVLHKRLHALLPSYQLPRRRLLKTNSLDPNSSKRPFLRAPLFVKEPTLAAPESTAVATMWRLGGSSFISQAFLWLDAPNCSLFGDVKATFMEQNWRDWTGSVFPFIPPEQWGVRSDARGKTRSWSLAGVWVVWMGRRRLSLLRTGGVLQQKARSSLRVVNCAKWAKIFPLILHKLVCNCVWVSKWATLSALVHVEGKVFGTNARRFHFCAERLGLLFF